MNKSFIFDWSGTLSDNFQCFVKVCEKIFSEFNRDLISEEEIKLNMIIPYMKFWNKYIPELSREKQCELYEKYIYQIEDPKLYAGVEEVIKNLHDTGWNLFVISSDPVSKLTLETKKSGLFDRFKKIVGGVHDKCEPMVGLVKEFGLDKNFTYYVGDTSGDVDAGKFAEIKTIGISWGFQHRDLLSKSSPDFLIDDILEIKKIVAA